MGEEEAGAANHSETKVATLHQCLLLGELPEDERERLEERLIEDDDFFGELLAAEDDLIDAAAAGELDPEMEERLFALPDLAERIAFSRTLEKIAGGRLDSKVTFFRPRVRRWAPGLAVAAALAMAVGLWFWQGTGPTGMTDQSSTANVASFVLPAVGLRGAGAELPVAANVDRVELWFELPEGEIEGGLQLVLRTRGDTEVGTWDQLRITRFDWGTAVRISLSAARLSAGEYTAILITGIGQGEPLEIGRYGFVVVRTKKANGLASGA
jgi:hypothetical protein